MPKPPPKGLIRAGDLFPGLPPPERSAATPLKDVTLSQRAGKRAGRIVAVREDREQGEQRVGYLARPFVLCGLPFKKPDGGQTYYRREKGDEVLEISAAPEHGLPFGMDYEVLIWVSTLAKKAMLKSGGKCPRVLEFASGADFLRAFDLRLDGPAYRSAQERFLQVFYDVLFRPQRSIAGAHVPG